jgi:hypothetical protein
MFELLDSIGATTANGVAGEHNTGWNDVSEFHRVLVLFDIGEPGQGATIDVDVEEAQDANGTGAQNVTGIAPAQIVAADTGGFVCIEFQTEDMTPGYRYINVEVTVANAAYTYAVKLFGHEARYPPVPVTNWHEVVSQ